MLIRDIIEESGKKYAGITAIKWLKKKEIMEMSYRELLENAAAVRRGLLAEGFAGAHLALIGSSSAEWVESYLGIITGNTVAVPLDANLPGEDLVDLLNRSDAAGLFLSTKQKGLLGQILDECPKLKKIWMLEDAVEPGNASGAEVTSLADLKAAGAGSVADADRPDPESIATIIFTSGTTGKSKGVMLTQKNLAENVKSVQYTAEPGSVLLSVLPIHHAFCLVMDWLKGFSLGTTVCINDSLLHMVKNMGVFQPQVMLMVPLMVETIYKRLAGADASIPKQMVAKAVFGGRLHTIFTGGAHLDPYYIDRFAEYGVEVLEGYGMSECSPVISSNTPEDHKKGSVGRPLPNVELSFDNGEILVRGSSVMKGYYQMPQETADTLKDGWLHTGDKGYLDEDGFLFINGRVKNLIILSNGENISPEEIENKLALGALVGEVIVTGENNGLTARIYPDPDVVAAKGMDAEAVQTELQAFLDQYNKTQPSYRQITGLVVRKNPFIKSATRKIKRQEVLVDEPCA
ncbi:AMP-binding enzyme [Marvinbryantia formatexigens DSM 14469]|uniref:AMP-binding enzyme n=1 Tax=Marvinbryantia formatexigens DSM 14469 TaxID=478749 RepID=C6LHK5_9FIRM|nr:AMP-binding protein [Marvinbryantia formatexigens]EET59992.1 AMP-binding enzyme [Marvinbryantia formatexigens DSM 14469]UWO25855.1 AMP-binding protein [Marvinbryantia formatexigens DSM 14469]SDF40296.1 long-chain acyl-CoA synthetase [Marvinbryantia formatexigens]